MTTIEQKIEEFEDKFVHWVVLGSTLNDGSEMRWNRTPEEGIAFLRQALEQVEKETRERDIDVVENFSQDMEIPEIDEGITKDEAVKSIKEHIEKLLPCPFCGVVPEITYRVDDKHSSSGSMGHFVGRKQCCKPAGDETGLFFCNDNKPANYGLWANMVKWIVFRWNKRDNVKKIKETILKENYV